MWHAKDPRKSVLRWLNEMDVWHWIDRIEACGRAKKSNTHIWMRSDEIWELMRTYENLFFQLQCLQEESVRNIDKLKPCPFLLVPEFRRWGDVCCPVCLAQRLCASQSHMSHRMSYFFWFMILVLCRLLVTCVWECCLILFNSVVYTILVISVLLDACLDASMPRCDEVRDPWHQGWNRSCMAWAGLLSACQCVAV